jgi:hypothetical protein
MGDLILSTASHQSVLIVLLAEFSSMYGLKIKTWSRLKDEFPGGHAYNQRPAFMKKLILSKNSTEGSGLIKPVGNDPEDVDPLIFHMSWTKSKENKIKFFKQMGEWYLEEQCNTGSDNFQDAALENLSITKCCAKKPIVTCHFKDKASMIPCPDAPLMDKQGHSFW